MTFIDKNTFFKNFHYSSIGINLNSRIVLCGHEYAQKGQYFWDGLKRGNSELIIWQRTISGCGLLIYEGDKFIIEKGQGLLLKIPHNHSYEVFPHSEHWEVEFIIFKGSECIRLGEILIQNFGPVNNLYITEDIIELAGIILDKSIVYSAGEASVLAYKFMMSLIEKYDLYANNIPTALINTKQYALEHYHETNLQVKDLAKCANMSYPYFIRQFNLFFNIGPGAYILKLRMEYAVNLLLNTSDNINEIADACGFASNSYFCRAFTKIYKMSPTQYRKQQAFNTLLVLKN